MTPKQRIEILKPRQTADLVGRLPGDERVARAIPDEEIENLKTLVTKTSQLEPVERLVEGTRVLVAAGPLKGARGIVHRGPDGRRRLVAQIELLGRGVSAELCADDVVEEIE